MILVVFVPVKPKPYTRTRVSSALIVYTLVINTVDDSARFSKAFDLKPFKMKDYKGNKIFMK